MNYSKTSLGNFFGNYMNFLNDYLYPIGKYDSPYKNIKMIEENL